MSADPVRGGWRLNLRVDVGEQQPVVARLRVDAAEVGSTEPGSRGDVLVDPRNPRRVMLAGPLIGPAPSPPEAVDRADDAHQIAPDLPDALRLGPHTPVEELIGLAQVDPHAVGRELSRRVGAGETTPSALLAACQRAGPPGIAAARATLDALHEDGVIGATHLRLLRTILGGGP